MPDILYDDCNVEIHWEVPANVSAWYNPLAGYSDLLSFGVKIHLGSSGGLGSEPANKDREVDPDSSPFRVRWSRVGIGEGHSWSVLVTVAPVECIIDGVEYLVSYPRKFGFQPEYDRNMELHLPPPDLKAKA